jgi:hypothetical protein
MENIYKHLPKPGAHDPALLWPFKVLAETKSIIEDDGVKEAFFKSLASSPQKARHENLRLAVLARLPQQWASVGYKLVILSLLLRRRIPPVFNKASRVLVPKQLYSTDTRPVTLVNDFYGFLTSTVGDRPMHQLIKRKLLPEELKAYIPGRSTDDINLLFISLKEDAAQFGTPQQHSLMRTKRSSLTGS